MFRVAEQTTLFPLRYIIKHFWRWSSNRLLFFPPSSPHFFHRREAAKASFLRLRGNEFFPLVRNIPPPVWSLSRAFFFQRAEDAFTLRAAVPSPFCDRTSGKRKRKPPFLLRFPVPNPHLYFLYGTIPPSSRVRYSHFHEFR